MTDIAKTTLERIRKDNHRPLPGWSFVVKNAATWLGFVTLVALGALSVSIALFRISGHDWGAARHLQGQAAGYLLEGIPLVWLALIVGLTAVSFLDFRHTRTGYRYRPFLIIVTSILISAGLGGVLYAVGVGQKTENLLSTRVPIYRRLSPATEAPWQRPQQGRLGGVVVEVITDRHLKLRDPMGRIWEVTLSDGVGLPEGIAPDDPVHLIGFSRGELDFAARHVRIWRRKLQLNLESGRRPPGLLRFRHHLSR